ncbi:TROVE domain-containing protein [Flavobacterium sp.]|uniref:TROVE domain-containing protein n=1 Tax=Flavobacterium sp. TaxID=239 RepID=UPI0039E58F6D
MKFNFLKTGTHKTVNHENAEAYVMTPEMELYAAVVTTGLNDSFYEAADNRLERIRQLMLKCDSTFIAKLAVYARTQMHLRSIPLVLSVELAKRTSGEKVVSQMVSKVVLRADEITELLAFYQLANQRTGAKKLNRLSKQIQKGLVASFNQFDEYQFSKYNRNTDVKLRDALFLVHPKAKDANQQLLFDKIAANSLATAYTWETELSLLGQSSFVDEAAKKEAFKQKWEELIESRKVGYMAMMRNLRNILEAQVSYKHIEMVCAFLSNEKAVLASKQLPFRFLAAYREVKVLQSGYVGLVLQALEKAVSHSAKNIKGFGADTSVVIACDVSGSMQKVVSAKSAVQLYDIGLMLAMLMQSQCKNVVTGMFGDKWKVINMPKRNILSNVQEFYRREGEVGYATNGYLVIEDLIRRKVKADKVMLFTDAQMWNTQNTNDTFAHSWQRYKMIAPSAKLYLFDLAGYGQMPLDIRQNDVYLMAGWSEKIFDVLSGIENKKSAVEQIHELEW